MFKKIKKWWNRKTVKLVWKEDGNFKTYGEKKYPTTSLWCPQCAKWLPKENEEVWTYMGWGGEVRTRRVAQCDCGASYDSGIPDNVPQSYFVPGDSKLEHVFKG